MTLFGVAAIIAPIVGPMLGGWLCEWASHFRFGYTAALVKTASKNDSASRMSTSR